MIYRLPSIPSTTISVISIKFIQRAQTSSLNAIGGAKYLTHSSVILVRHSGTALNWFRSYLSSHCFHVKCNKNLSSLHTCLCGDPQGSVLGPLLFVMYTTPLSTLISSMSLNHHLYADDAQLFHQNSTLISLTCKMLYNRSLPG